MKSGFRDIATGVILILFSIFGYFSANQISEPGIKYGPDFLPKLILILLAILSLSLVIKGIVSLKNDHSSNSFDKHIFILIVLYIILLIVYINIFFITGFIISTIIFLFIAQYLFGLRKWFRLILVSLIVPFVLYYFFTIVFNIPLP